MKSVRNGLVVRQRVRKYRKRGVDLNWDYVHPLCIPFAHRPAKRRPAGKFKPVLTNIQMRRKAEREGWLDTYERWRLRE